MPDVEKVFMLTILVYSIVESMEKFGMKRKVAHLLAIPIGVIISVVWGHGLPEIIKDVLIGVIVGILSVGTCDTLCNFVDLVRKNKG